MTEIRDAFASFAVEAGYQRHGGSWYCRGSEVISVLNLQKSQYGSVFYINVAEWLLDAGPNDFPKESRCHIRTRLSLLVSGDERTELEDLLNGEQEIVERGSRLRALLATHLRQYKIGSYSDFATEQGRHLLKVSLVNAEGERHLAAVADWGI